MKIIDDFLPEAMCRAISADVSFFPESMGDGERIATEINSYHTEQSSCFAPYMFWKGWHYSEPKTIKQRVIKKIWENNLPFPISELCGFEYWTRTFHAGQYIAPHVDEDTFLYQDAKIFAGPKCGAIYYGPDTTAQNGGFLEIYPEPLTDFTEMALEAENISKKLVSVDKRERVACLPNRLVMLDAGHVIHGTTPSVTGTRNVMVINVWHKSVEPKALSLGAFFYE